MTILSIKKILTGSLNLLNSNKILIINLNTFKSLILNDRLLFDKNLLNFLPPLVKVVFRINLKLTRGLQATMKMSSLLIEPSLLKGKVRGSPSKSQAIRSLLFASLAEGKSTISNLPFSPDVQATVDFCREIGAKIEGDAYRVEVHGVGPLMRPPQQEINVGNSGLLLRLAAPLLAMNRDKSVLTGDQSIQRLRPTSPLISALKQLGAEVESTKGDRPPLKIRGPIHSGKVTLDGTDSQPVSAMLIASTLLEGETEINVTNPGERPWIDLTLDWLSRSGVDYSREGYHQFKVKGGHTYRPFDYIVPNDFGSLGFLIAAGLITHSELRIEGFDLKGYQADRQILDIFQAMGANLDINVRKGTVTTTPTAVLKGIAVDVNDVIDALPILAVVGCFAESTTVLYNGQIARKKESDRIFSITRGLRELGANIDEQEDGLVIYPSKLIGNSVSSFEDHRIAMSLAVAGLGAKGQTLVKDTFCISKSYPNFVKDLISLGANIRKVT